MPPKRHPQGAYKDRTVYDQDYSWPSTAEVVEVQPHRRARPPCMPGCYDGDRLYRLELQRRSVPWRCMLSAHIRLRTI